MIGELVHYTRRNQGITIKDICRGLCSVSTISRYEYGMRKPDHILLNALIQRMGKSPDDIEVILTKKEYEYVKWKNNICDLLQAGEWRKAEQLRKEEPLITNRSSKQVRKQFAFLVEAIIARQKHNDIDVYYNLLEKALRCTVPEFDTVEFELNCRDENLTELYIRLLMIENYYEGVCNGRTEFEEIISRQRMKRHVELLLEYVENRYIDSQLRLKIYPFAVQIAIKLFIMCEDKKLALHSGLKLIFFMEQHDILLGRRDILREVIAVAELAQESEIRELLEAKLKILKREEIFVDQKSKKNVFYIPRVTQGIYRYEDILKRKRKLRNVTQEEMAGDECSPVTIARREQGKSSRKNVYKEDVLEKCSEKEIFIRNQIKELIKSGRYERARVEVNNLVKIVDMSVDKKIQYDAFARTVIDYKMNYIDGEQALDRCWSAIEITLKAKDINDIDWTGILLTNELRMLNYISAIYRELGREEESIDMINRILAYLKKNRLAWGFSYNMWSNIFSEILYNMYMLKMYNTAIDFADNVVENMLIYGCGKDLREVLKIYDIIRKSRGSGDIDIHKS